MDDIIALKTVEIKEGRNWIESYYTGNPLEVYQSLTNDLIAKKINACTYIRSIKRQNLYNGYQKITVNYDNHTRAIYTVRN